MWSRWGGRRIVAGVLIALNPACHSWQVTALEPQVVVEKLRPKALQVRQSDGTRFVLRNPHLAGDSLRGLRDDTLTSVHIAQTDQLAVRGFSPGKTALLVGGILGGIFAFALVGCAASDCGSPY
jgi:hypothetical protein